jgi:hypothetical protein
MATRASAPSFRTGYVYPSEGLGLSFANYDWKTGKKGIRQTLYFMPKNQVF